MKHETHKPTPMPAPGPMPTSTKNSRADLLAALETMPEEAFGYFVGWASGVNINYGDELGGFMPASQTSINALRAAARAYRETVK